MVVEKTTSPVLITVITILLVSFTIQCGEGASESPLQVEEATSELDELKEKLITANRILDLKELANPYGHVSVRIPNSDRILITSNKPPSMVTIDDVLVVNLDGEVVEGAGRTYGEVHMHTRIYNARADVNSVAHTHSAYVKALTIAGLPFQIVMNEAAQYIGPAKTWGGIGMITSGELGDQVTELLGTDNALLLRGHGAVVVAPTIELATVRAVFLESSAEVQLLATSVGTPVPYTTEESDRFQPNARPWQYYSDQVSRGPAR